MGASTRAHGARPRRYALHFPTTTRKDWETLDTTAMKTVFGNDDLEKAATTLFQAATTKRTDQNYSSNMRSFFEFCNVSFIEPQDATPIDIARYMAWLGERGTVAASSLQPYLSSINK